MSLVHNRASRGLVTKNALPTLGGDTNWANTVSILRVMNSGALTTDESPLARTYTAGSTSFSSLSPFAAGNGGSFLFAANGSVGTGSAGALDILGSNFTVEAWIYPTATPSSSTGTAIVHRGNSIGWVLRTWNDAGNFRFQWVYPGLQGTFFGSSLPINTWTHVAVVRVGTTHTGYVNGVGSTISISNRTSDSTDSLIIGGTTAATLGFTGNITNVRVAKTAIYTSNFTPATTPLPNSGGSTSYGVITSY